MITNQIDIKKNDNKYKNSFKLIAYSLFGIFMFFASIEFAGKKTIPVDHVVSWIKNIPYFIPIYGGIMITIGTVLPFINGKWQKDKTTMIFSFLNIFGLLTAMMVVFNVGPYVLLEPNMSPYVFNIVTVPVVLIVPVGSIFLAFLVDYGLMELIGVIMRPIMKPIWKTPGRSAIDAVTSFVGSYSLALLVTNRIYKEGKYNTKEATIIATGFSTVSATFMIILANTLDIMKYWNAFFWITIIVTFLVTAIVVRLYPLKNIPIKYYENVTPKLEDERKGNIIKRAWNEGINTVEKSPTALQNTIKNLRDGTKLAINIGPSIMSIGVLALLIAEYTPVFNIAAYIFYPITLLLKIPEPMLVAKASAITLADMYVPALIATEAGFITRFIIAILCISELLFLSASIPCILSTEIPISLKDLIVIWFWRVILTLLIATPIVYLIF